MKRYYVCLSLAIGCLTLSVATAQRSLSVAERVVVASPYAIKADAEADAFVTATAERAYAQNCASCHGADMHGKPGVPDLVDYEFIWGVTGEETSDVGPVAELEQTIRYGVRNLVGTCYASRLVDNPDFNQHQQPVVGVDWYQATKFAEWKGMLLPTEAQWEYAARGSEGWVWPWGNDLIADNLVYRENSGERSSQVGSKPNTLSWVGALDLSGLVWEWCLTVWRKSFDEQENDDLVSYDLRVLRGGSWDDTLLSARAASRFWSLPDYGDSNIGFRVIFDPVL